MVTVDAFPWLQLMHYLYDLPVLLRHLVRDLFTAGGLRMVHRLHLLLLILLTCAYLLSPLDLIPEAVFGLLGLLDDLVVMLLMLLLLTIIYRAHMTGQ